MFEDINNIKNDIQEYLEVRLDLFRLQIAENLSRVVSSTINIAILGFLLFFILFFISFAAGYFFASLLHSNEMGFLCVAGFYILLLVIYLIFRKQIIDKPVIKATMKLLFPKLRDNE